MFDDEFEDFLFPELTLETDDITMNLVVKKDYSYLDTIEERKKEFLDDLRVLLKNLMDLQILLIFLNILMINITFLLNSLFLKDSSYLILFQSNRFL